MSTCERSLATTGRSITEIGRAAAGFLGDRFDFVAILVAANAVNSNFRCCGALLGIVWRFQRWVDKISEMNTGDLITVDSEILGGTPVFKGTRVPIKTLFEYLEDNYPLDEFLECFPTVTREMACQLLERSESALLSPAVA